MKRRHFIQAGASSLLLPAALEPSAGPLGVIPQKGHYSFFDERFRKARRIAAAWSTPERLFAVQGDVTPVWSNSFGHRMRDRPLVLCGVTTESFRFCLRILAGEHATIDSWVSRLDRNLLLWTMSTTPKLISEERHG